MSFPNSLAELKRYIKSLENIGKMTLLCFQLNGNPDAQHKFKLLTRQITSVNSVGFGLTYNGLESYCDWPKAKNLMFYPENRVIHINFENNSKLVYRIEEENETS